MTTRASAASASVIHLVGGDAAGLLCSALVRAAVEHDLRPVVIDADPWGGGADVLLGLEHVPGVRWHDLHGAAGDFDAQGLFDRLPCGPGGERVLTVDRTHVMPHDPRITDSAVLALTTVADLVVVMSAAPQLSARIHRPDEQVWVVAGSDVRSCAAGVAAAQWLSREQVPFRTALMGGRPAAAGCDEGFGRIDRAVPITRSDRRDVERGELCGRRRRGLGRHARQILAAALANQGRAA